MSRRKKKTDSVKKVNSPKKPIAESVPTHDPEKTERTWRYPWEKAWRIGLTVKWN